MIIERQLKWITYQKLSVSQRQEWAFKFGHKTFESHINIITIVTLYITGLLFMFITYVCTLNEELFHLIPSYLEYISAMYIIFIAYILAGLVTDITTIIIQRYKEKKWLIDNGIVQK